MRKLRTAILKRGPNACITLNRVSIAEVTRRWWSSELRNLGNKLEMMISLDRRIISTETVNFKHEWHVKSGH